MGELVVFFVAGKRPLFAGCLAPRQVGRCDEPKLGVEEPPALHEYVTAILTIEVETLAVYHHGEPVFDLPVPLTPLRYGGGEECYSPQRCPDSYPMYFAVNDLLPGIRYGGYPTTYRKYSSASALNWRCGPLPPNFCLSEATCSSTSAASATSKSSVMMVWKMGG